MLLAAVGVYDAGARPIEDQRMSPINAHSNPYASRILDQHRLIDEHVKRVRNDLAYMAAKLPTASEIQLITEGLKNLKAFLAQHFMEEEGGGYLRQAIASNPKIAPDVKRLEREHPALMNRLDSLINTLDALVDTVRVASSVAGAFNAFSDALAIHESLENHVLEKGYNTTF
jgi:hypothetical protein